jgi:hypothetical protein
MTEYERGFASKCAEFGITERQAGALCAMRKGGMDKEAVAWMAAAGAAAPWLAGAAGAGWLGVGAVRGIADHASNMRQMGNAVAKSDAEYTSGLNDEQRERFNAYMRAQDQGQAGTMIGRGWNSFLKGMGLRSQESINQRYVDQRRQQAEVAFQQLQADELRRKHIAAMTAKLNPSSPAPAAPAPAAPAPAAPSGSPIPPPAGSTGTPFASSTPKPA